MPSSFFSSPHLAFAPWSFIELDDVQSGRRLLALVLDSGDECVFFLDDEHPPVPLPIFAALNPVAVDSPEILLQRVFATSTEDGEAFAGLIDEVSTTLAPYDELTFMRSICWALAHEAWDLDVAVHAALLAGDRARVYETWVLDQWSVDESF